ncbi:hypothetical protein [Hyphomicrobium sp.]|uniref:hypothetical protein n=1 Tax=Hyphomicrobium sp. TaxID=82 RepID=UPI002D77E98B|nr:hypothetical protein [Hyphomicrobium sp.]HET6390854.1 hypothetical protein [Hyphomicrobium sp.]
MDLKMAGERNSPADRLALASMIVCFLATGALLIGTLAAGPFDQHPRGQIPSTTTTH